VLRVISFIRAMWWLVRFGESATHIQRGRQAICQACPSIIETRTGYHCSECGCPQWFGSDIRTKTRIGRLRCPIGKW
jgi:hypothetical protein